MLIRNITLFALTLLIPVLSFCQNWNGIQQLSVPTAEVYNGFGSAVHIHGNTIMTGVPRKYDDRGMDSIEDAGAVYVYEKDLKGKWNLEEVLYSSNTHKYKGFGASVVFDDNIAAFASPSQIDTSGGNDRYQYHESVFIFKRESMDFWHESQIIRASDADEGDGFGYSLDIHGSQLIIGAPYEDQDSPGGSNEGNSGAVYLFKDSSGLWVEKQKLFPQQGSKNDAFGTSVAINGQYLLVGTPNRESVYVFKKDSSGNWIEHQTLRASDFTSSDRFGSEVEVYGSHAVVGAPFKTITGPNGETHPWAGAAYIFRLDSNGYWQEVQKLVQPTIKGYGNFGNSVTITTEYTTIGAPSESINDSGDHFDAAGALYIYKRDHNNNNWVYSKKLTADTLESYSYFTSDISAYNEDLIVGSTGDGEITSGPDLTSTPGRVYAFAECPASYENISISTCGNYTVPSGKSTYDSTGIYLDTLTNSNGCDSIIVIDLYIKPPVKQRINEEMCFGDIFNFHGQIVDTSGIYSDTLKLQDGCDSIVVLELLVIPLKRDSIYKEICSGESFNFNGREIEIEGTYRDTVFSIDGCDSVSVLDLRVKSPITDTVFVELCKQDTFKGNLVDTFRTMEGCDSIVKHIPEYINIDTTVENINDTLVSNEPNATYQWLDCEENYKPIDGQISQSYIPSVNGTYAVRIMKHGCVDTSMCLMLMNTSVETNTLKQRINTYPNPTTRRVFIVLEKPVEQISATVYNLIGEMIELNKFLNTSKVQIQLPESAGLYFILLEVGSQKEIIKVLKE